MIRVFDNGAWYSASIGPDEVRAFLARWPAGHLPSYIWAQFDKRSGDLVDLKCGRGGRSDCQKWDGPEMVAITEDMQCVAEARLGIDTGRCEKKSREWPHTFRAYGVNRRSKRLTVGTLPDLDEFTKSYIRTALWSSTDESDEQGGEPLDENYGILDIARPCIEQMVDDCEKFQEAHANLLADSGLDDGRAGHDFWLSRNGHGAGFFDEGTMVDDELQEAARAYGEVNLYVEKGLIYCG